ncbi:MAG: helix-hairpin-helix domain-containing protein [Maricaulaceae bacterium]
MTELIMAAVVIATLYFGYRYVFNDTETGNASKSDDKATPMKATAAKAETKIKPKSAAKPKAASTPKAEPAPKSTPEPAPAPEPTPVAETPKPKPAPAASQGPDDLKKIKGVGPKLEEKLNNIGVTSYAQIVNWTAADIARVDGELNFKGRIERDEWQAQARALMAER